MTWSFASEPVHPCISNGHEFPYDTIPTCVETYMKRKRREDYR